MRQRKRNTDSERDDDMLSFKTGQTAWDLSYYLTSLLDGCGQIRRAVSPSATSTLHREGRMPFWQLHLIVLKQPPIFGSMLGKSRALVAAQIFRFSI